MSLYGLAASWAKRPAVRSALGTPVMVANEFLWNRLPQAVKRKPLPNRYGHIIGRLVKQSGRRDQNSSTCFLRNRPEFELLKRLARQFTAGAGLRLIVLGCSEGAEVYTAMWSLATARPDLQVQALGVDIAAQPLAVARSAKYPDARDNMFHRLTAAEKEAIFERRDGFHHVRPAYTRGVEWSEKNILSGDLDASNGTADVVIANRFMCHMQPAMAGECLIRVLKLVKPGGHVFVSGIDEDVRERIAREYRLTPVMDDLEGVYYGDPSLAAGWPFRYWGLEPIDKSRPDWPMRYAPVFKVLPEAAEQLAGWTPPRLAAG